MKIEHFPCSESPNTAILRLTKNFGLKKTKEHSSSLSPKEKAKKKLAAQVYKEMCNLLQKMEEHGIKVITVEEDKYIKNNQSFFYPDQAFLTDTGHYLVDDGQLYFIPAFFKKNLDVERKKLQPNWQPSLEQLYFLFINRMKNRLFLKGAILFKCRVALYFF